MNNTFSLRSLRLRLADLAGVVNRSDTHAVHLNASPADMSINSIRHIPAVRL